MRTTLDLNDSLLTEAKRLAAEQGVPLRQVVEDGLRRVVMASRPGPIPATWPVWQAKLRPGVDPTRTSALIDLTEAP